MIVRNSHRRGFTLIELLIVVAIIAILAAIALVNFLEAQVRAKISRVRADYASIATAEEAYRVDYNSYTCDGNNIYFPKGWNDLTSPVAYITAPFKDPFEPTPGFVYDIGTGSTVSPQIEYPANVWVTSSEGPDRKDNTSYTIAYPYTRYACPYDPTNGSTSNGDLYRFGGEIQPPPEVFLVGNYFRND